MVNDPEKYQQYNALILGGSSGLGLASAQRLAAAGMGIFIVHRNTRAEMKEIAVCFNAIRDTGVPFQAYNADVSNAEQRAGIISRLQEQPGRFRCLLHSIAKGSLKAMHDPGGDELSSDDLALTMQYMAYSLYDWTKDMLQAGIFAGDARILAFTSEGSQRASKHYAAVSAAKAALETITRSIALEFAGSGLRANCIQAGITPTASLKRIPGSGDIIQRAKERNPFKRLTTPEDVAAVVYLLCRDEAAWINGSIIPVDGGEHIC